MKNIPDHLEILACTHSGEFCTQKEWNTECIPLSIRAKLK